MSVVLYIDKNANRQGRISKELASVGLEADAVAMLSEANDRVIHHRYQVVLLQLDETEYANALVFCSSLSSKYPAPFIIVGVNAACLWLEERLFDCGVDDVVVGTGAHPRVVAKRVKARLRTRKWQKLQTAHVQLGDVMVDFDRREVTKNGRRKRLPGSLADLLWYFVHNAGHIVSRQELNECSIWANSICTPAEEGGKTFDVHVGRLRKIIEKDPSRPMLIQSVRGFGWTLAVEPIWNEGTCQTASFSAHGMYDSQQLLFSFDDG